MPFIIEATPKNPALVTRAKSAEGLRIFTNPQLLALHNAALGKNTSKFASRAKALSQTWEAIKEFAGADIRVSPPTLFRPDDKMPEEVSTPASSGIANKGLPTDSDDATEAVIPGSLAAGKASPGRPKKRRPAAKQADGTYLFGMEPRVPRSKVCGGRRPELIALLRKRPTFAQLVQRYKPNGDTDEKRAFNLATAITCMCHVCGYGVNTAPDGRIDLLEPLA